MIADDKTKGVHLFLHPDERAVLAKIGKGRQSKHVALAMRVLTMAPPEIVDRARLELAKRDAA